MPKLRSWSFILAIAAFSVLPAAANAALEDISPKSDAALYGSVAVFRPDTSAFPQWIDVMRRAAAEQRQPESCGSDSDGCAPARWRALEGSLRDLPLMQKLETVNEQLNAEPYVTTWRNWHQAMYWESPYQFLARGGQCQDYAISKYLALHDAGVGDDVIRVQIVHDTDNGLDHAVLVADVDGSAYVLDNLNPRIVLASADRQYRPYYAINLSGYWMYFGGRSMVADDLYGRQVQWRRPSAAGAN